jgi:hypothetical protein
MTGSPEGRGSIPLGSTIYTQMKKDLHKLRVSPFLMPNSLVLSCLLVGHLTILHRVCFGVIKKCANDRRFQYAGLY